MSEDDGEGAGMQRLYSTFGKLGGYYLVSTTDFAYYGPR